MWSESFTVKRTEPGRSWSEMGEDGELCVTGMTKTGDRERVELKPRVGEKERGEGFEWEVRGLCGQGEGCLSIRARGKKLVQMEGRIQHWEKDDEAGSP